ncbi:hypothetical protein [Actinoplanes sp. NBRC 103695]|uniref:hypothetical protein n=1 Tax=Actinoplanes sp. NBRC 103695 TaxID=3032202 RepID=UPI0024A1094C|nr:hypothetical protein [Actinoplanes sp. NBRC 103695]GLZ00659.1 hypothetical protein Acsp02_79110 [Actinoplanes sp. NBRC 103695]
MTTAVFRNQAPVPAAHFTDLPVEVDPDMIVIGGGATAAETPNGALLTASYPNDSRSAWLASSKDHRVPNPHSLTAFAIGMKVNSADMPRTKLKESLLYTRATGAESNHPRAIAGVPDGFTMVGGGFRVNWPPGAGNLVTGSFCGDLDTTHDWEARSKDHITPSPCTIDVWSVAIRSTLGVGGHVFRVDRRIDRRTSTDLVSHPFAELVFEGAHVLTGVGAKARVEEPGQLIWRLEPTAAGGRPGVTGGSKDHQLALKSIISVSALGIRLIPN